MHQRLSEIDAIRGISILLMIFVHAASYFLGDPIARTIWNLSQFIVIAFIFCSSYLFYKKTSIDTMSEVKNYLKKRVWRLLVPYYYYLGVLLLLMLFINPKDININFLRMAFFVTSQNDISWLVLLFLQVMIMSPVLSYIGNKTRLALWLYGLIAAASSMLFLFFLPPVHYKFLMWLPWSLVILGAWYFARHEEAKNKFFIAWVVTGMACAGLLFLLGRPLEFYDNKYPPNLYYLSYGMVVTLGLLMLFSSKFSEYLWRPLRFLSVYSYSLYFIHFLLIYVFLNLFKDFALSLGWFAYFVMLLLSTLGIQWILIFMKSKLRKKD